jgi:putative protease
MTETKIPELLAPAGSLDTALAAFDAGADAVYAGLSRFNARERADNFNSDSLGRLIGFARKNHRRVYLTVNTLIKEKELPEMMEFLGELAVLGPDAVIVQDLGVLRMLREYYPQLKIHASTQMGFHNSAGLRLAARLGVERVILERQLTMEEMAAMSRNSPVELEVFIHGALCCSLSGRCLLSSWMGNWSGNRGKCKQPCRRLYQEAHDQGFFFSPKDLCGIDLVPQFRSMGVTSFKIEGRLRRPDYVWKTVAAYRMAIDSNGERTAEARHILDSVAGRVPSQGFYTKQGRQGLIEPGALGVFGTRVGVVRQANRRGFSIAAEGRIHVGDRFRAVPPNGDEGFAFTIIKMEMKGEPALKAVRGQECFIPGDYPEARPSWQVYKIGENGYDFTARAAALPPFRHPLDLRIEADKNGIAVRLDAPVSLLWEKKQPFAPALKQPLTPERLADEFGSGAPAPFAAGRVDAVVRDDLFIPASELKQLRREFWEYVGERVTELDFRGSVDRAQMRFYQDYRVSAPAGSAGSADGPLLPAFCAEAKLGDLRKRLRDAYAQGKRRFRLGGIYGLELLKEFRDIEIAAVFPLPVCNSLAARELKELGCVQAQPWLELEKDAVEAFAARSPLPLEPCPVVRPELLVSRFEIQARGDISDGRGNSFRVEYDRETGMTVILPDDDPKNADRFSSGELK